MEISCLIMVCNMLMKVVFARLVFHFFEQVVANTTLSIS